MEYTTTAAAGRRPVREKGGRPSGRPPLRSPGLWLVRSVGAQLPPCSRAHAHALDHRLVQVGDDILVVVDRAGTPQIDGALRETMPWISALPVSITPPRMYTMPYSFFFCPLQSTLPLKTMRMPGWSRSTESAPLESVSVLGMSLKSTSPFSMTMTRGSVAQSSPGRHRHSRSTSRRRGLLDQRQEDLVGEDWDIVVVVSGFMVTPRRPTSRSEPRTLDIGC